MKAYHDPAHPHNGPQYHTGKPCIERGCTNPAGTAWSPVWCQPCNAKRMDRISGSLEKMAGASGVLASDGGQQG